MQKKPEDWDDRAKIDDPDDKKPEDWDKPELIKDPDAKKNQMIGMMRKMVNGNHQ